MEMAAHLARRMYRGGHRASAADIRALCPTGSNREYEALMNLITEDNELGIQRRRNHNIRSPSNVYYRDYQTRGKGILRACLQVSNCLKGYMKKYECLSQVKLLPAANFGSLAIAPSNKNDQRRIISINGLNKSEYHLRDPKDLIRVEENKGNIFVAVFLCGAKDKQPTTQFRIGTAKNRRLYLLEHGYFTTNPIEKWGNTKYVTDSEFEFLWTLSPREIFDVGYSIDYRHPTFGISKIHLNSSPRSR
jgi:hypothetical protein